MRSAVVTITIADAIWSQIPKLRSLARRVARHALAHGGRNSDVEIAIKFAGDAEVAALNRRWRNKSAATNVLSFPAADSPSRPKGEPRPLGDIILAAGVIAAEARAQGKTLEAHTMHLIVHGVLHLLGFDHQSERDAKRMETAEVEILVELGYGNPYLLN
jgi:probable rRNA maturation factor